MSSLIKDRVIDVVKITLTAKDASGTRTLYFSDSYFQDGELYSGSPVIYPLLASAPTTKQAVGRTLGARETATVIIYGKVPFDENHDLQSVFDLHDLYEFYAAPIELRKYWKTKDAITTHADATNIRQVMQIVSTSWDSDILTISCRDTFFEDKALSKVFNPVDFPSAPEELYGTIQPIALGKLDTYADEPVISAHWIDVTTDNPTSGLDPWYSNGVLHAGYVPGDLKMGAYNTIYVENKSHQDVVSDRWVPVAIGASSANAVYAGVPEGSYASGTAISLSDRDYGGVLDLEGETNGRIVTGFGFMCDEVASNDAPITVTLAYCRYDSVRGWLPFKTIYTGKFDIEGTDNGTSRFFMFDEPILLLPGTIPYLRIHWPDFTSAGGDPKCYYGTAGTFEQSQAVEADAAVRKEHGFVTNSAGKLQWTLYQWYQHSWDDGASSDYASLTVRSSNLHAPGAAVQSNKTIRWEALNVKLGVNGIEDRTAGTYTGSGNTVMQNPAHIMKFLAQDDQGIGVSVPSAEVDSTTMTGGAGVDADLTSLGGGYNKLSVAIEQDATVGALMSALCLQCRMILYKLRTGKLALFFPTYSDGTAPTHVIDESKLGDSLVVVSALNAVGDPIINQAYINYDHDPLSLHKSVEQRLLSASNAYLKTAYNDGNSSSDGSTGMQAKALASQTLYGKAEIKENWLWTGLSEAAEGTLRYLINRYSSKQWKTVIRVLNQQWNTVALFDTITVRHRDLSSNAGAIKDIKIHQAGKGLTAYSDGMPITFTMTAAVTGFVSEIVENGEFSEITIETESAY